MRRFLHAAATFVALSCFVLAPAARADGLFYNLPEDGTSATYDLKAVQETQGQEAEGTLTLRSVGRVEVNGEPARWLEVSTTVNEAGREHTIILKLLVKEKNLKRGERVFDNFEKLYLGTGERAVQITDVSDERVGPLPAFFSGPLSNTKKLEAKTIETGAGKLKCPGESGTLELKQGEANISLEFENYFHESAPFGVAHSVMKFKVKRAGADERRGVLTLTLSKTGKGATSALPDSK